jgi:hypothetical protein
MRALVVNCSAGSYNLGSHKLADWLRAQGHTVDLAERPPLPLFQVGYDLVALSVVFSWHAPIAADIALCVRPHSEVWCGGPGMTALGKWWRAETGLACTRGLDPRFERQRGHYEMAFASRGCPVGCSFCIVPVIESTTFTLDWDFEPAPVLCDNNLSALPVTFQEHILQRYAATGTPLRDANSGFEPQTFDAATYQRWKSTLRGPWRFAFDTLSEGAAVEKMMRVLRDVPARRKQVYVLAGNEPLEGCLERALKVIEWGGEPFVQPMRPLNALRYNDLKIAFNWTPQRLIDFARFFNRRVFRVAPIWEYSNRRHEPPPFEFLRPRAMALT